MNNMKRIIKKLFKSKKAQSMVEMAILLPLLLLILFAIIEFGIVLGGYMIMHDLARDGVRAGVVGATQSEIVDQIKDNALIITIEDADIHFTPALDADRSVGGQLEVEIEHTFNFITPIINRFGPLDLSAEYVMRIEKLPAP